MRASASQVSGADANRSKTPSWVRPALVCIIVCAALLRLWGIDYGLPYEGITYNQITWEEVQEVHRALKLGAGEYAWRFGKGGLYLLLFLEYGLFFAVSWLFGWVSDSREFAIQFLLDRTPFYLMGRLTNLFLGLLTYVVIYAIGKRLYGWKVGLIAAAIGGSAYFHGIFSTVINVDIGMTLALWASVLAYVEYRRRKETRFLIATGILAALAIAFKLPGISGLLILAIASVSAPENLRRPTQVIREGAVILVSLCVTLTLVAPEWIGWVSRFSLFGYFFGAHDLSSDAAVLSGNIDESIFAVTVLRGADWTGFLQQLVRPYNIILTISVVAGLLIGILRRHRWDLILGAFIVIFLVVMSSAWRTQSQHYLLPIMPAMWLVGSRAIAELADRSRTAGIIGLALIMALPVTAFARYGYETSQPDTRIQAKHWIEMNVPDGAKILIDAMQYRYIPSPPLNPNTETLDRQIAKASTSGESLGRGVSQFALSLYQEAQARIDGPKYDLHSTIYGINIQEPSHYVRECFDYIVTSSYITKRFAPGRRARRLYPAAALFYESLPTDRRFSLVYEIGPEPWKTSGPTIQVYQVISDCSRPLVS